MKEMLVIRILKILLSSFWPDFCEVKPVIAIPTEPKTQ